MDKLFHVSAAPHVRSNFTTSSIMRDVVIALVPASAYGIYHFGLNAAVIIAVCIATSVLCEYLYEKGMHKKITIGDYSAVVTGLLIALNMPSTIPVWIPMLGCAFAIIIVKQLYGGLGQNFMNPALAARCFLLISFTSRMTTFVVDGVSSATPLALIKAGETVNLMDMFIGNIGGVIGETSVVALLLGAAYLVYRQVITLDIPLIYIGTFALFVFAFGQHDIYYVLCEVCGGGLMLGAFYMATDYVTSPITPMGKVIYGIILGLLTGIFRLLGNNAEGVSYAIIISNLLVPLIETYTIPKPFGKEGKK